MMTNQHTQNRLSQQEIDDINLVRKYTFMDRVYEGLPLERKTEAVSRAAVLADSLNLMDVPKNVLPDKFILDVLRKDGELIFAVDKQQRTPAMYQTALESTGLALKHFPQEAVTPETSMAAVRNNGMALEFVPEHLKTPGMCRTALNNVPHSENDDHELIRYVPFPEVCMEELRKCDRNPVDTFMAFGNIQPKIVTPEMAQLTVRLDPECFMLVPEHLKTPELCIEAVNGYWYNLNFVPEKMKTKDLCNMAIKGSSLAIDYIPDKLKTPALYMDVLKNDGAALRLIPVQNRTPEMCLQAVMSCPAAGMFVPERVRESSNVYTFREGLEKEAFGPGNFSYGQVQRLYNGGTVKMTGPALGNLPPREFVIDYDRTSNRITIKPLDNKPEARKVHEPEKRKGVKM